MKKAVVICLIALVLINFIFVSALDEPDATGGIGQEDAEKIQDFADSLPLDDSGQIDPEKLNLTKTKAEERIDAINAWMDENVWWLEIVFGMRPEISWKFGINIILIYLLLNFFLFDFVKFGILSKQIALVVGIGLTIIAIQASLTVKLSGLLAGLFSQWWFRLIVILALFALAYVEYGFGKWAEAQRLKKAQLKIYQGSKDADLLGKITDKFAEVGEDLKK